MQHNACRLHITGRETKTLEAEGRVLLLFYCHFTCAYLSAYKCTIFLFIRSGRSLSEDAVSFNIEEMLQVAEDVNIPVGVCLIFPGEYEK
jgi:hypothetical protein